MSAKSLVTVLAERKAQQQRLHDRITAKKQEVRENDAALAGLYAGYTGTGQPPGASTLIAKKQAIKEEITNLAGGLTVVANQIQAAEHEMRLNARAETVKTFGIALDELNSTALEMVEAQALAVRKSILAVKQLARASTLARNIVGPDASLDIFLSGEFRALRPMIEADLFRLSGGTEFVYPGAKITDLHNANQPDKIPSLTAVMRQRTEYLKAVVTDPSKLSGVDPGPAHPPAPNPSLMAERKSRGLSDEDDVTQFAPLPSGVTQSAAAIQATIPKIKLA